MWLFTPDGIFSIVEPGFSDSHARAHAYPGELVVRARAKKDLDTLRARWCPQLRSTHATKGRDYGFRAYVSRDDLATAMARITLSVDYSNYKDEAMKRGADADRMAVLHRVWADVTDVQYGPRKPWYDYLPAEDTTDPSDLGENGDTTATEAA